MGIGVHFLPMLFQMLLELVGRLVHIPVGLQSVCMMATMAKIMAVLVEIIAMLIYMTAMLAHTTAMLAHTMAILDEALVKGAETLAMYIETWLRQGTSRVKSEKIQRYKVCW